MTGPDFDTTVAKLASSPLKLALLGKTAGMGEKEVFTAVGDVIAANLKPGGTQALKRAIITTGLMTISTVGGMVLKDLITDLAYGDSRKEKHKGAEERGKLKAQESYQNQHRESLIPAQTEVFQSIVKDDEVLADADPVMLKSTFSTMQRFAPSLASDPNAVRSFLRESAAYGIGPNYAALKNLAEAERAVSTIGR